MTSDPDDAHAISGPEKPPWSVSNFVPPSWLSTESQLDKWEQGHIAGPFPATWLAPTGTDQVTRSRTKATKVKPFYSDEAIGWCIVVSQTCDISAKNTGGKQPFVIVAPVRPGTAFNSETVKLANAYRIPYLFPTLSPEPSRMDEAWFADLRLLVPISKGLLVSGDPIPGLKDGDAISFASTIAHKFSRPALEDVLSQTLPAVINKHILDTGKNKSAYSQTEHVRLQIDNGGRLAAKSVTLMVLGKVALTPNEQEQWRLWEPKGVAVLRPQRIELGATLFTTPEEVPASLYRAAVPLRIDNLGQLHWL